jgi:hypothetical protein
MTRVCIRTVPFCPDFAAIDIEPCINDECCKIILVTFTQQGRDRCLQDWKNQLVNVSGRKEELVAVPVLTERTKTANLLISPTDFILICSGIHVQVLNTSQAAVAEIGVYA